jgi:hypothetical protein
MDHAISFVVEHNPGSRFPGQLYHPYFESMITNVALLPLSEKDSLAALILPSKRVALRCQAFLISARIENMKKASASAQRHVVDRLSIVCFTASSSLQRM